MPTLVTHAPPLAGVAGPKAELQPDAGIRQGGWLRREPRIAGAVFAGRHCSRYLHRASQASGGRVFRWRHPAESQRGRCHLIPKGFDAFRH